MRTYYEARGVQEEAYWNGGYELGIGFPPDWVGHFIYDKNNVLETDQFEPMSVANHEAIFFSPMKSGLSFTIETFLFGEKQARIASKLPREIQIV